MEDEHGIATGGQEGMMLLGWKPHKRAQKDVDAPHLAQTQQRMGEHPVVRCLQDPRELNFTGQQITSLGPLSYEAQRGMYLHPNYAVCINLRANG